MLALELAYRLDGAGPVDGPAHAPRRRDPASGVPLAEEPLQLHHRVTTSAGLEDRAASRGAPPGQPALDGAEPLQHVAAVVASRSRAVGVAQPVALEARPR